MFALQVAAVTASFFGLIRGQAVLCDSGVCSNPTDAPANATRSVNFKPFRNNTEWTWRVNVTDFMEQGNRSVHFSYDFSWPGGGNLTSVLPRLSTPYCAAAMFTWGTPANITDKYTDEHTKSTDCTPVIGEACVNAILTAALGLPEKKDQSCVTTHWWRLPECADTFGVKKYGYAGINQIVEEYSLMNRTQSGRPFHVVTADNNDRPATELLAMDDLYAAAVNMLQVVLLRPPLWLPNETFHPTLHCMRVMTNNEWAAVQKAKQEEDSDNGLDGGAGGNEETDKNGTGHLAASLWVLVGSLGFAALL